MSHAVGVYSPMDAPRTFRYSRLTISIQLLIDVALAVSIVAILRYWAEEFPQIILALSAPLVDFLLNLNRLFTAFHVDHTGVTVSRPFDRRHYAFDEVVVHTSPGRPDAVFGLHFGGCAGLLAKDIRMIQESWLLIELMMKHARVIPACTFEEMVYEHVQTREWHFSASSQSKVTLAVIAATLLGLGVTLVLIGIIRGMPQDAAAKILGAVLAAVGIGMLLLRRIIFPVITLRCDHVKTSTFWGVHSIRFRDVNQYCWRDVFYTWQLQLRSAAATLRVPTLVDRRPIVELLLARLCYEANGLRPARAPRGLPYLLKTTLGYYLICAALGGGLVMVPAGLLLRYRMEFTWVSSLLLPAAIAAGIAAALYLQYKQIHALFDFHSIRVRGWFGLKEGDPRHIVNSEADVKYRILHVDFQEPDSAPTQRTRISIPCERFGVFPVELLYYLQTLYPDADWYDVKSMREDQANGAATVKGTP